MNNIYANPQDITDIDDCYFYHTMDIPEYGTVHGEWDLRGREGSYLGNVALQGKRVLEVGTASGYLCFYMEQQGSEVVAYDLSSHQEWDIVPYYRGDCKKSIIKRKEHLRKLNNGFWFAHSAYNSKAKVVYGTVYEMPKDIGEFDICTFGSILLHLRDPFLALQRVSAQVKDTIIITDVPIQFTHEEMLFSQLHKWRLIHFLPNASICHPEDSWWRLSPELIVEFIQILGFEHTEISYHTQIHQDKEIELYTVVGRRGQSGIDNVKPGEKASLMGMKKGSKEMLAFTSQKLPEEVLNSIEYVKIVRYLLKRGSKSLYRRLLNIKLDEKKNRGKRAFFFS